MTYSMYLCLAAATLGCSWLVVISSLIGKELLVITTPFCVQVFSLLRLPKIKTGTARPTFQVVKFAPIDFADVGPGVRLFAATALGFFNQFLQEGKLFERGLLGGHFALENNSVVCGGITLHLRWGF